MITLSLMIVAVALALLIGIPLGIWSGRSDRAERLLRGFLDTAQVMPAYVYLLPVVVAFGIGVPAGGRRDRDLRRAAGGAADQPRAAQRAGRRHRGRRRRSAARRGQLLRKVQLPMARRAILLGLNQVIMMAFGIVVHRPRCSAPAALGGEVLSGLQKIDVGAAFVPGLAIVFAAIALDRITHRRAGHGDRPGGTAAAAPRGARSVVGVAGVVAGRSSSSRGCSAPTPSRRRSTSTSAGRSNDAVGWVNDNLRNGVPIVGGTRIDQRLPRHPRARPRCATSCWRLPWWLVIAFVVADRLGERRMAARPRCAA